MKGVRTHILCVFDKLLTELFAKFYCNSCFHLSLLAQASEISGMEFLYNLTQEKLCAGVQRIAYFSK